MSALPQKLPATLPFLDEEQARRRRNRMMKTLKENAAEEKSSMFAANSASSVLGWIYGGLLCLLIITLLGVTFWLKPFLLVKFLQIFQTPEPIRLVGVFPSDISPSKHLPIVVPPNLALATAENARDRRAIQIIQEQQQKLSNRKQKYHWNVVEMDLDDQQGFLTKDQASQNWIPSISEFSSWSRERQVDFFQWYHLLNDNDLDGILEYGTVHFQSRILFRSPINIVVEIIDKEEGADIKKRRLLPAFVLLNKGAPDDKRKVFAQSVLQWIVQIENEANYQLAFQEYLYELFESDLNEERLVGECRYSKIDDGDEGWRQWARYCPQNNLDDCCEIYLNPSSTNNHSTLRRLSTTTKS